MEDPKRLTSKSNEHGDNKHNNTTVRTHNSHKSCVKKHSHFFIPGRGESNDRERFDYEKKEITYAISNGTPDLCCCYDHKIGHLYVLSSSSMNWMIGPCWP